MRLDPLEPRVLLSADPLTIIANDLDNDGTVDTDATGELTVRIFEEDDGTNWVQKAEIAWAGGAKQDFAIGGKDGFEIQTGMADDDVSVIFDTSFANAGGDFGVEIDTGAGDDTLTITRFDTGFSGDITLVAETITIDDTAAGGDGVIGSAGDRVGDVTLTASSDATVADDGTNQTAAAAAAININADIYASGAITGLAEAAVGETAAPLDLKGLIEGATTLEQGVTIDVQAHLSVADNVTLDGGTVSLDAETRTDVSIAPELAVLKKLTTDITTKATVTVGDGATLTANGTGSALSVGAMTDTDVTVDLKAGAGFLSGNVSELLSGASEDTLSDYSALLSTINLDRVTSVDIGAAGGTTTQMNAANGVARVTSLAGGDILNTVTSNLFGLATTAFTKDANAITMSDTTLTAGTAAITARSDTLVATGAKIATNTLGAGGVTVDITGSDLTTTGASQDLLDADGKAVRDSTGRVLSAALSVRAVDASTFSALASSVDIDANDKVHVKKLDLEYASAINRVHRDVSVTLTGTDLTAENDGDIVVQAASDAQILVEARKLQSEDRAPLGGVNSQPAYEIGGTLAVNEITGEVATRMTGGKVTGADVSLDARNDLVVDAVTEAGAGISGTEGASFGLSVAFNMLGYDVGEDSDNFGEMFGNWLLAGVDTILGEDFGGLNESPLATEALATGVIIVATGHLSVAARGGMILNSTVSNTTRVNANSAFRDTSGASAGFILSNNKVATSTKAQILGDDANNYPAGDEISAGTLSVIAHDDQQIGANTLITSSASASTQLGLGALDDAIGDYAPADYRVGPDENGDLALFEDGSRPMPWLPPELIKLSDRAVDMAFGDRVMVLPNITGAQSGTPGTVYKYMGTDGAGLELDLDALDALDFDDTTLWQPQLETEITPAGKSFTNSDTNAFGGMIVRNEVQGAAEARVADQTVTVTGDPADGAAMTVQAIQGTDFIAQGDLTIISSGGNSLTGGGTTLAAGGALVVNTVNATATADLRDSDTTVAGALEVNARNETVLDATLNSALSTGSEAAGVLVAFNTVGYAPQNLLFQTLDALIGTDIGQRTRADTTATISGGTVEAGAVAVTADNVARIEAVIDSDVSSAASAFKGAGGYAAQGVLASNMLAGAAVAEIRDGADITATAGDVAVTARDVVTLNSTTALGSSQSTSNDLFLGMVNDLARNLLDSYDYTTASGTVDLVYGDVVLVADPGGDGPDRFFKFVGDAANGFDLSTLSGVYAPDNRGGSGWQGGLPPGDLDNAAAFTDVWKEVNETTIIPPGVALAISSKLGFEGSGSKAYAVLITRNEAEGGAHAAITDATVSATDDITITARETATLTARESSQVAAKEGFGGAAATNTLLSKARAYADSATLTAGQGDTATTSDPGSVTVEAFNLAIADTLITTEMSAKADAKSVLLSFNAVGFDASNIFFQALDAVLGASYLTDANPAGAEAYLAGSDVTAAGDVSVTATSREHRGSLADGVTDVAGNTDPEIADLASAAELTALALDDAGRADADIEDIEADAATRALLREAIAALEAARGADAIAVGDAVNVETLAGGAQWYVTDSNGNVWQVLFEEGALEVYRANLLDATVGNDATVGASNDRVLVDRMVKQDQRDQARQEG